MRQPWFPFVTNSVKRAGSSMVFPSLLLDNWSIPANRTDVSERTIVEYSPKMTFRGASVLMTCKCVDLLGFRGELGAHGEKNCVWCEELYDSLHVRCIERLLELFHNQESIAILVARPTDVPGLRASADRNAPTRSSNRGRASASSSLQKATEHTAPCPWPLSRLRPRGTPETWRRQAHHSARAHWREHRPP